MRKPLDRTLAGCFWMLQTVYLWQVVSLDGRPFPCLERQLPDCHWCHLFFGVFFSMPRKEFMAQRKHRVETNRVKMKEVYFVLQQTERILNKILTRLFRLPFKLVFKRKFSDVIFLLRATVIPSLVSLKHWV